jgi:ParB/RepB/Spo0J family partition protein
MELRNLSINEIRVGYHPRKGFRGKGELKEGIRKDGLTDPIRVRPENDCFIVIDGNRRLSVLKELGYETVPCIIEKIDERTAAHHFYVLNGGDYRRNLNPIEVSIHIKEMRERFGYSVQDLLNLGYAKDDQTVYNKLSLLTLPQEIQDKIAEGTIIRTEGYKLAGMKDAILQKKAAEIISATKDRSVRKSEKVIKNLIDSVNRKDHENIVPAPSQEGDIPGVFFHDSGKMQEFQDGSIPLIVVSPSYGVGMEYEKGVSFDEHIKDLKRCVPEWGRKLMKGGHLCINFGDIHNFGTTNETEPEIQLMGHTFQDLLRPLGIRLRDIIIWDKGLPFKNNRQVRAYIDTPHTQYRILNSFEYIYIFKKDGRRALPIHVALKSAITKDEWKEWVSGIWKIKTVFDQKGHPAQFPDELPRRLIKMFSCEGDIVVDTALGSGTTIKVARELGRKGFGYERDEKYKPIIIRKLGIKEGDLNKQNRKPDGDFTGDENTTDLKKVVKKFLPEIVAEAKDKGERISRISFSRKPNLTKDEIIVETVPVDDDPPPTSPLAFDKMVKADGYQEGDGGLAPAPSPLAKAA